MAYPKSLSVVDMLKLGKVISKSSITNITLSTFDLTNMEWSPLPNPVGFQIDEDPFAMGGFRKAYKARSQSQGFKDHSWVVKRYLQKAAEGIKETGQSIEEHTKKSVQMHSLARNFALQLKDKVDQEKLQGFGMTFEYKKVYIGQTDKGEFVTVEEFINGDFAKYINNNGDVCSNLGPLMEKAECFAHFTFEKSQGKLIVLDLQGSNHYLYDPEIASSELLNDDGTVKFCNGNLTKEAIDTFFSNHECNFYCNLLKLKLRPAVVQDSS